MESTAKIYNPLAYQIDNVSAFDEHVVKAFKKENKDKLKEEIQRSEKKNFEIFICVNKNYHAFVLCVENMDNANNEEIFEQHKDCTRIELCFEDENARMFQIRLKKECIKNITIKTKYEVGTFENISDVAIQFAALGASKLHYKVLIYDCVEFAKEFCKKLSTYASNGDLIREQVNMKIKSATASGFTGEELSRQSKSSAYSMNTFLGGSDVSSFLLSRKGNILLIFLFFVYPFVVNLLMTKMI